MRQKRAKAYRKLMHLYSHFFGFRQPYQLLIDSETCKMAVSSNMDLVKQLANVLQGEVKPMITQCCIHELYLEGNPAQPAVDIAKMFERRKCNHREAIPGDDCLADVIGDSNKHRYVISTQSSTLRTKLRSIPAVPIIHINRSVLVLEPPSDSTLRKKALAEQKLLGASTSDAALIEASQPEAPKKVKKKGPKGPNPLSVRKKKTTEHPQQQPKSNPDKGKGKVMSSQSTEKANLGKRKRGDEHDDEGLSPTKEDDATQSESSAKKRRRRRKKLEATKTTAESSPSRNDD
ncbi:hypothetical protein H1R20_g8311, partial [Candolleomyces eurysporus]